MVTAKEAKTIVRSKLEKQWNGRGAFAIGGVFQDAKSYAVEYGNKEYVTDNDSDYMIPDAPIALVDKATGKFELAVYPTNQKRFDSMKRVN